MKTSLSRTVSYDPVEINSSLVRLMARHGTDSLIYWHWYASSDLKVRTALDSSPARMHQLLTNQRCWRFHSFSVRNSLRRKAAGSTEPDWLSSTVKTFWIKVVVLFSLFHCHDCVVVWTHIEVLFSTMHSNYSVAIWPDLRAFTLSDTSTRVHWVEVNNGHTPENMSKRSACQQCPWGRCFQYTPPYFMKWLRSGWHLY